MDQNKIVQKSPLSVRVGGDLAKPHPKYRNIVFDLGAVLIYFDALAIIDDVFKDENPKPHELFGAIKTSIWYDVDRGLRTRQEAVELLADQYDKEKLGRFMGAVPTYLRPLDQGLAIFDAVREHGFKTYILSNLSAECYAAISSYDFLKKFDGAVFSYRIKVAKPDPEIYHYLLNEYSLDADECLFIDDLPQNIAGAKALGIDGIVLSSHAQVVTDLQQLKVL